MDRRSIRSWAFLLIPILLVDPSWAGLVNPSVPIVPPSTLVASQALAPPARFFYRLWIDTHELIAATHFRKPIPLPGGAVVTLGIALPLLLEIGFLKVLESGSIHWASSVFLSGLEGGSVFGFIAHQIIDKRIPVSIDRSLNDLKFWSSPWALTVEVGLFGFLLVTSQMLNSNGSNWCGCFTGACMLMYGLVTIGYTIAAGNINRQKEFQKSA